MPSSPVEIRIIRLEADIIIFWCYFVGICSFSVLLSFFCMSNFLFSYFWTFFHSCRFLFVVEHDINHYQRVFGCIFSNSILCLLSTELSHYYVLNMFPIPLYVSVISFRFLSTGCWHLFFFSFSACLSTHVIDLLVFWWVCPVFVSFIHAIHDFLNYSFLVPFVFGEFDVFWVFVIFVLKEFHVSSRSSLCYEFASVTISLSISRFSDLFSFFFWRF